jgi:hypothetical protein
MRSAEVSIQEPVFPPDNRLPSANFQGHPYGIFKLIEAL